MLQGWGESTPSACSIAVCRALFSLRFHNYCDLTRVGYVQLFLMKSRVRTPIPGLHQL
jgi:hypothetical protein